MNAQEDRSYFEEVYRKYYPRIVSFILLYCKDMAVAENLAQDTFYSFLENIKGIDRSRSPIGYLCCIAKNKALNHIKKQLVINRFSSYIARRDAELSYKSLDSLVISQIQLNQIRDAVVKSLGQMNAKTAETFKLSRFNNLKNTEIASLLNISVKTVEYRMMSAMRIIRANLAEFITAAVLIILS